MTLQPPPGQGPVDPGGAFSPPPPPPSGWSPPPRGGGSATPPPPPPPGSAYGMPNPAFFPPRPRERSFARAIFTTLATTVLGFSVMLNIYLLAFHGLAGGSGGRTNVIREGSATEKVAVVPVNGTIMDDTAQKFDRYMTAVEKDSAVKAVILDIDTPGGSVTASDVIYERVRRYKAEHPNIPVIATQGGLATSGGYYVSCAADYVFAQPTTLTGNIGVLMPRFNLAKLMDKWGIEETTIASTGATFKNAGSMFKTEKPEETAYIQGIADNAFKRFKEVVSKGRGSKLKGTIDAIANGKVYTADEAIALGLVDKKGYPEDAYAYASANLTKPTIVRYTDSPSLVDLFRGESNTTPDRGMSINGIKIDVDKDAVHELTTPRLMYLWRGE